MTILTSVFDQPKPVLAMLHLKGEGTADVIERALREIEILTANGVDALVVENYFGTVADVEAVLARLAADPPAIPYGVNVLDDGPTSFELAHKYGAGFVQMDSVAGHLPPQQDEPFAAMIERLRADHDLLLLGGVRFKYQPVRSGNPLAVDLELAQQRCDAVVVTGDYTGQPTSGTKIQQFRDVLGGDFPLIVGAGVTAENCAEQLRVCDAAIVGSSLKAGGDASAEICASAVQRLMAAVRRVRGEIP